MSRRKPAPCEYQQQYGWDSDDAPCDAPADYFVDALWDTYDADVCARHLHVAVARAISARPTVSISAAREAE